MKERAPDPHAAPQLDPVAARLVAELLAFLTEQDKRFHEAREGEPERPKR